VNLTVKILRDTSSCDDHCEENTHRTQDGKNLGNAKIAFVKMKVNDATKYPVKIEGTDILVEIV